MPCPSPSLPGRLSLSNFHRFIPKQWRRVESGPASSDDLMIDSLSRLLEGFVKQGDLPNALRTFFVIRVHASSSSASSGLRGSLPRSASSLLLLCANLKQLLQGKQLHAQIVSLGLHHHPVLVPRLVNFYTAFDLVSEASVLVRTSDVSRPFAWNLLISCHVRNGLCKEAISIFREMLGKGVKANEFTYPTVLKACGEEFYTDFGEEVHKLIADSPFGRNLFVQNALMSMYGRFGEIDVVRHLFEQMPERDAVSWNTLISAYAFKGMWKQAFELFESMWADGIELTSVTRNTIAGGCLSVGNYRAALELISQIRIHGNHLDCVATLIGLGACSHIGALKLGKEIHGSAVRSYYHGFNNVRSAMITMYSRCKDLKHAHILFQSTDEKSITTWNSMISGYCHSERCEEASFLFREMLLRGIEPNFITIASILPLCARVANLQHGREFHCYIVRRECFVNHLLLWNALVDMYARSGKVLAAKKVFDMMTERDAVTYTSLIAGYGVQGEGQIALRFFKEMITSQITPDHVTMAAVLSACSHTGMVIQGERLFEDMQRVYLITPHLEHYACMVDLYGRAGLLAKASDIIARMPHSPTPAMWATLVGACRKHRNLEMGKWAAGKLLEMRPENSGYYTLVANMYAAAGCWNELAVVRALMRDLGVKKAPGCAWLDVGSCFSPFVADDTSSPHADEIYPLMEGLSDVMKDAGHIDCEDMNAEVAIF